MAEDFIKLEFGEANAYIQRMATASEAFKKDFNTFLEALGIEFLRICEETIIKTNTVDTRRLLQSFKKGAEDNIWEAGNGFLTVGTNVTYAEYANDGHNQSARFVPGTWSGDHFNYQPGAKTGMMLKVKWVEGSHYWDIALYTMEKLIPKFVEKKLDEWLNSYFAGF